MPQYKIAGLTAGLSMPDWMIEDRIKRFACENPAPDLQAEAVFAPAPKLPDGAQMLVRSPGQLIYAWGGDTHFCYTPDDCVCYMAADGGYSRVTMNIGQEYNRPLDESIRSAVSAAVSGNLRRLMMARLALERGLMLHSCVIKWQGCGVLFSAVSGTGKSTHAHLWQELYPGVEILNGDNGLLRFAGDAPRVYGAPWCGTSGEYQNDDVPVRAIVFLEQAKENSVERLDKLQAVMRIYARCFLPFWDKALIEKSMNTAEQLAGAVDCFLLRCRPDHDAVRLVREWISK